ncbi:conserved hypothetical protein [Frankia canadensis]|uniref:Uncharacterized protein n=1 Tax=Frankia canadensis TaxID=1836972 RepID=A0A2I2L1P6_9ACTN|nr:hypothetical protein [Frankia canadensis]SNQ51840.1 conserved hypothetical protein [Frankia canadensis]SOU59130.1 conserved hypothetical protein [Frankia canadensis]
MSPRRGGGRPPGAAGRPGRFAAWRSPSSIDSRIGLWGATSSGKTTMLAALHTAMTQQDGGDDDWILFSANEATRAFLARARAQIARREFPVPSPHEARELSLSLLRPDSAGWARRLVRRGTRRRARRAEFHITLMDVSGRMYAPATFDDQDADDRKQAGDLFRDEPEAGDAVELLVDHLARADGMVYLFDPLRELETQDSYQYLESMVERVLARAEELGRLPDGKLPHYLAVCINKIDDRRVFNAAYDGGFLSVSDSDEMLPEITREDAADLFRHLCSREMMGGAAGSGPWVRGSIERHFHPGRVRYFASSSIGFYVGSGGTFRIQDFANIEADDLGRPRIRGRLNPVNVLEPFLWLAESIRAAPTAPALESRRGGPASTGEGDGQPGHAGADVDDPLAGDDAGLGGVPGPQPRSDEADWDDSPFQTRIDEMPPPPPPPPPPPWQPR